MADPIKPDGYASQYYSYFDLSPPDSPGTKMRAYTLTGVALCTIQGGGGARWRHADLHILLQLPGLNESPPGNALLLRHWAPYFSLNSISNDHVANDAGWAVDSWDQYYGPYETDKNPTSVLQYMVHLAVGDSDGFILRVGYNVNVVGEVVP